MNQRRTNPDSQYARGEIPGDERQNPQPSVAGAAPALQPRARGRDDRRMLLVAAVLVVAGTAVAATFLWSLSSTPGAASWTPSYGTVRAIQAADFASLNASATPGTAGISNNSLWFHGASANLVIYMSPPDHDMTFIIQGMVDPAIHVQAGSHLTLTVVNLDGDMYHNWALSRTGPPYTSMPMMGPGSVMSTAMLSPASGGTYWSQATSFTAASGSYWYLCEYAGHAASGMYGSFAVG